MINNEPAGVIYEWAGRHNGTTAQSARFIKAIRNQSKVNVRGKQGRIAIKTVEDNLPIIENDLRDSVTKATNSLNRKLAR